jgi:hypothetical protein
MLGLATTTAGASAVFASTGNAVARPHNLAGAARLAARGAGRPGPPVTTGTLRITGSLRDGGSVTAAGLSWRPGRLPAGERLLSFEVGYAWRACTSRGRNCRAGADSSVTPFAARRYAVGHADAGRRLSVTETATEVVRTTAVPFRFAVLRVSRSATSAAAVGRYPAGRRPVTEWADGLPEVRTGSTQEYFHVDPPHFNAADGPVSQFYRIDTGPWLPMPRTRVFYTGTLALGQHSVTVVTLDRAGPTRLGFRWRVVPLPAPLRCRGTCWYPPHLNKAGQPMRWDWQIGRTVPLRRTGKHAVDIYDIDGFLTTRSQVHAIRTSWQASTLAHPRTICYLDLAWEDYRPDASTRPHGLFPAAALGTIYFGYPEERWVDFRQLNALKPMLKERIAMCARKGFDAVELDDIDSFDPPSTTGFNLTAGDARNYLAYAFNLIHSHGMTALWKNNPALVRWGARYSDGAVLEECYLYRQCKSWDVFTADRTATQPNGKWVGDAEYGADHFVCDPGRRCQGRHSFAAFCRAAYGPPNGFAAVKFDVDLDGKVFYPCPRGR